MRWRRWQTRWHACIALALLSVAATQLPGAHSALEWQRAALDGGQWYRLLTAHFPHLGPYHLLFNLLGLLLISELLLERWRGVEIGSLILTSAIGASGLLWYREPGLQWYVGLSGLLHGLWAGAALSGSLQQRSRLHLAALVALAAKLFWLNAGTAAIKLGPAIAVVSVAHVYGAASGLAWAVLRRVWRRLRHFD